MSITTTKLTRAAGLSAVVGGLLFIAVQIKHPLLDATFTTTTEYAVREALKIFMAVFSLIGITGIYLRQVRQTGLLGLIGYVVLGVGYLAIFGVQVVGVFVLPSLAASQPGYVNDVFAVATSGTPVGDVCRQLGVSEATFYAWKKKYAHLDVSELRRLRQLEDENNRLKRLVADLTLDKHMLSEALRKKA